MMFRFLAYTNQPTTQYIGPLQPSTNNNSNGSSSNSSSVISSSPVVTSSAQSLPTATLISPQKQSAALATAAAIQQQQQYQHAYHSQQQQQQQQQATNGAHGSNAYHAAIAQAQAQLTAQMQAQQQAVALAQQQQQQLNFLPQVRNQLYYHRHLKMFLFLSLDAIFYSTSCSTTNVLYNTQWSNNISIRWSKLYSCTSTWSNNDHRSSSYVFCWSCFT
jgi:hypothetical protein